ncbi:hypothetical protein [Streptomyces sp. UNOB3_S3]|uniref:hypothetical protein n=1 Tax=Streptomyces sp. UNOB3_S3 TaxID=2871682 RepID=UPI001E4DB088|nr:hypothetical protein [Streptomyces sp. UNOB3_S3]MCC3778963.1 hypothetical protein [Streptomyces sp. UNOB3_S3]
MNGERERRARDGRDDARGEEQRAVLRPDATVLRSEAVIPRDNVVRPAPNRFSHILEEMHPYWFERSERTPQPDGMLPAGTSVLLLREEGDHCRVVTGTGLYVTVARANLREQPGAADSALPTASPLCHGPSSA